MIRNQIHNSWCDSVAVRMKGAKLGFGLPVIYVVRVGQTSPDLSRLAEPRHIAFITYLVFFQTVRPDVSCKMYLHDGIRFLSFPLGNFLEGSV